MKRKVIGLIAALPFALGAGVAQAHEGHWGQDGYGSGASTGSVVAVAGTITSTPASDGSFTANAFVPQGEGSDTSGSQDNETQGTGSEDSQSEDSQSQDTQSEDSQAQDEQGEDSQSQDTQSQDDQGEDSSSSDAAAGCSSGSSSSSSSGSGSSPATTESGDARRSSGFRNTDRVAWQSGGSTTTPVTIPTDSSTTVTLDGAMAAVSDLKPGDRFVALFAGSPCDSLTTLTSKPAVAIDAHSPRSERQLYAFVGTLKSVDTTANTVTVQVTNSLPSGLVGSSGNPATFTVSGATAILGGSSGTGLFGGSLSDLAPGDVVAGAEFGSPGESLSQVESSPLSVLVDFPATTGSGTTLSGSLRRQARTRALEQTLALFGRHSRSTTSRRVTARRTHHHTTRRQAARTRRHTAR